MVEQLFAHVDKLVLTEGSLFFNPVLVLVVCAVFPVFVSLICKITGKIVLMKRKKSEIICKKS